MPHASHTARLLAGLLLVAVLPLASGCAEPKTEEPDEEAVAPPPLAPPPPRLDPLAREDVVKVALGEDEPDQAIERLDQHPFDFELDPDALQWLAQQGLDPQVNDYLEKRSKVDWESLRGDVDPNAPR